MFFSQILADMLGCFSRRCSQINCIIFLADLADLRRSAFPILCALCVSARNIYHRFTQIHFHFHLCALCDSAFANFAVKKFLADSRRYIEYFFSQISQINCIIFLADLADLRRAAFPILCDLSVSARKKSLADFADPRRFLCISSMCSMWLNFLCVPFSASFASLRETFPKDFRRYFFDYLYVFYVVKFV